MDTVLTPSAGTRQTELALMLGTLFTAEQALKIGLVDEVGGTESGILAHSKMLQLKSFKVSRTILAPMHYGLAPLLLCLFCYI